MLAEALDNHSSPSSSSTPTKFVMATLAPGNPAVI